MTQSISPLSPKKRLLNSVLPRRTGLIDRIGKIPAFVDFVRRHPAVPVLPERNQLYEFVSRKLGAGPIDYLEFGVFQGESMRQWSRLNAHLESRFWGFDSFFGLPEEWDGLPVGAFSTKGKIPEIANPRVNFINGTFQETLPHFLRNTNLRNQLVINNDSDLYSSTLYVLTMLNEHLVPGTVVIFDEFDDVQHEFRAFNDYNGAYLKKWEVLVAIPRFRTVALRVR